MIFRFDMPQAALFLWALMSLVSLIRWTSLTWATQGRLWFVAIACLAAISAVGFYEIARRLRQPYFAVLPVLITLMIAVFVPFVYIRPAYAVPDFDTIENDIDPLMTFTDPVHPDESISLMQADFPASIQSGEPNKITLAFCTGESLSRNWSVFVHVVNEWDIILAQADFTPGYGAIPTAELQTSVCWHESYAITVQAGAVSENSQLDVLIGLYDAQSGERMRISNDPEETRYRVTSVQLKVGDALQKFVFADAIRIADYDLSAATVAPGDDLILTINWGMLKNLDTDYTVFVQILDPRTAHKIAASDLKRETGVWQPGEIIEDIHHLMIADDAPAGRARAEQPHPRRLAHPR